MASPIVVEYVWCSGADTHHDLRSKCKTITVASEAEAQALKDHAIPKDTLDAAWLPRIPDWNFDGSSTGQHRGTNTEIYIRPVRVFYHPFERNIAALVVLAECYFTDWTPTPDNTRNAAKKIFDQDTKDLKPWFGLEQEYALYRNGRPLGWPENGFLAPQGPYYCSNGSLHAIGRDIVMDHYVTCLNMGLKLSGINAEVMPSQWEYQVGPCEGIESGDHAVMARWVYLRIGEKYNVDVVYSAKPVKGDWNGSGMHTNFSTLPMRTAPGGHNAIVEAVKRLDATRVRDLHCYGADNNVRLSGHHETSKYDTFAYGYGTRHTSVRISNVVKDDDSGYFEDRRPAADADPFLVTARLFASACGFDDAPLVPHMQRNHKDWMGKIEQ